MAQIGIIRIDGLYYREYEFAAGDRLDKICLDFGEPEWGKVWNLDANQAFRAAFNNDAKNANDPAFVVQGGPPRVRIPLIGGDGGENVKLSRLRDYILTRIVNINGLPLRETELFRLNPGAAAPGVKMKTTTDGDIAIVNLANGEYRLVSLGFEFTRQNDSGSGPVVATAPLPGYRLQRNTIDTIVARRVFYIACPMCNVDFRTVAKAAGVRNLCPNDEFDLTQIEERILQEEVLAAADPAYRNKYLVPAGGQNPAATPTGLTSRGTRTLQTSYGQVVVCWDESRFLNPEGGDYTLWGKPASGQPITATITGRTTWGANPPIVAGRLYTFQETLKGASLAYTNKGIPSNENLPLKSVFEFLTVHHTQDPPSNSFQTIRDVQRKHQTDHNDPDVAYHFVIDGDGRIYEGIPLGIKGSHSPKFNGGNIGISVAGQYDTVSTLPPLAQRQIQRETLMRLVDILMLRFGEKNIGGHRQREITVWPEIDDPNDPLDGPTVCPGANLRATVDELVDKYRGSKLWEQTNQ